jgi:hypothetical protein
MRRFRALLRTVAVFMAMTAPAASKPWTITESGTYVLTADHGPVGADFAKNGQLTSIEIRADHVLLDLNGKAIRCGSAPDGIRTIGVGAVERSHVTIRNGGIVGCVTGVNAAYGNGHVVEAVEFRDNLHVGLNLGFGQNNRVTACVFNRMAGYVGEDHVVALNGVGSRSLVEHNTFRNVARRAGTARQAVAILVADGDQSVLIRNNRLINEPDSDEIGIWLAEHSSAEVIDNEITGFGRGMLSAGWLRASGNRLTLRAAVPETIGIYTQRGYLFQNQISGFAVETLIPSVP